LQDGPSNRNCHLVENGKCDGLEERLKRCLFSWVHAKAEGQRVLVYQLFKEMYVTKHTWEWGMKEMINYFVQKYKL